MVTDSVTKRAAKRVHTRTRTHAHTHTHTHMHTHTQTTLLRVFLGWWLFFLLICRLSKGTYAYGSGRPAYGREEGRKGSRWRDSGSHTDNNTIAHKHKYTPHTRPDPATQSSPHVPVAPPPFTTHPRALTFLRSPPVPAFLGWNSARPMTLDSGWIRRRFLLTAPWSQLRSRPNATCSAPVCICV